MVNKFLRARNLLGATIDNIRPMDWKLISATVTIRVSRPRAEWLVVLLIT